MLSIRCINHMPYLSTITVDFRSILSSTTSFANINHCLGLITKKLALLLYTERKILFKDDKGSRER